MTLTVDGRLLVIGGCSINDNGNRARLRPPPSPPLALSAHSSVHLRASPIPIGIPQYNDDVRQLDTSTMVWTRPRVHPPNPSSAHSTPFP